MSSFLLTCVFLTWKFRSWSLERLGNAQGKRWFQSPSVPASFLFAPHKSVWSRDIRFYTLCTFPSWALQSYFFHLKSPSLGYCLPGSSSPHRSQVLVLLEMLSLPSALHPMSPFSSFKVLFTSRSYPVSLRFAWLGYHLHAVQDFISLTSGFLLQRMMPDSELAVN